MHFTTLFVYALSLLTVAHAYAIPVKRIRIPSTSKLSPSEQLSTPRRHARFMIRQEPSTSQSSPATQVITLVASGSASSALFTSATSSATPSSPTQPPSSRITTSSTTITTPFANGTSPSTPSSTLSSSVSGILSASTTEVVSAPSPSTPPIDSNGTRKYVVAHHMVGNTFPYTLQDWADDVALAHASGIDGFALNVGSDDWQPARVADAYQAAKQSGLDFKLFLSLDMSAIPCSSADNAQAARKFVTPYLTHPNQLQYDSRAFVSTFAGESCNFGQSSVADGWKSQFVQNPDLQGKIYFVPAFFIDPATFSDFAGVMDGDFNWNSGWPTQVTTSFAQNLLAALPLTAKNGTTNNAAVATGSTRIANAAVNVASNGVAAVSSGLGQLQNALSQFIGSTDSDKQHLDSLNALSGNISARDGQGESKKIYMAAVSPWFFTHYGKDSFNKNFIFLSDQHLYSKRWESIIDSRDQFDIVEILTWNDYGESHYVGPIKGDQPNSEAWTDGMNHTSWLGLTQYYATAFKTGEYPAIEKDQIYMWSRPHPSQAQAADPVGQPDNFELSEDSVWAVVLTTAPSTVTITTSDTSSKTFNVPAGLSKLSAPISAGGTMKGTIARDGKTVVELAPADFTFQGNPKTYNFNAFVASASAE